MLFEGIWQKICCFVYMSEVQGLCSNSQPLTLKVKNVNSEWKKWKTLSIRMNHRSLGNQHPALNEPSTLCMRKKPVVFSIFLNFKCSRCMVEQKGELHMLNEWEKKFNEMCRWFWLKTSCFFHFQHALNVKLNARENNACPEFETSIHSTPFQLSICSKSPFIKESSTIVWQHKWKTSYLEIFFSCKR